MTPIHPMRPVEFLILAELQRSEHHGYGLVKAIEARTDGAVRLSPLQACGESVTGPVTPVQTTPADVR